jgi:predicted DNA-binding transcriptional regulator AlpA
MAPRPISVPKFAEAVATRLVDVREVAEILGVRSKQTIYNRIEAGLVPPPVLKLERGYAFWDRLAILRAKQRHTTTRR